MASDSLFDLIGDDTYRPLRPTTKGKPVLKTQVEQATQTVPPPLFALDLLWQDALALVKPFSTQMMLRQQCRLLAFDGWAARIGTTSPPLFKMASDRMPNMEAAFAQLCDHPIKVSLEIVPVVTGTVETPAMRSPAPPRKPPPPHPALGEIWLDVLALVTPFSSQMMLRQQCRLLKFGGDEARICTTSLPLFRMAKDRLPDIEAAFAKFCSRPIRVSLEVVPVDAFMSVVPTYEAIAPSPPATDLPRHIDWEGSMAQSRSDYGFFH